MIRKFKHKGLKKLFEEDIRKGINSDHVDKLIDILDTLHAAAEVQDMNFPGSGLHPLQGNRKGDWAVEVSGNWRVTFKFKDGDAFDVNYEDYH